MAGGIRHPHGRSPGHSHIADLFGRGGHLRPARGRFIAFEGGEGSGKSTQAAMLAAELDAVLTREPGGTALGAQVRRLVLDGSVALDARAETLMMLADRAQHVAEVVRPALEQGRHVVTDRFSGSTLAYQGWGRGLEVHWLARLCSWASAGLEPDLVILLDLDPDVAQPRLAGQRDRIESAGEDFHARVAAGYRALATGDPRHWVVLRATGTIEAVAAQVRLAVASVVAGCGDG